MRKVTVKYKTNKQFDREEELEYFISCNLHAGYGFADGALESVRERLNASRDLICRLLRILFENEVITEEQLFEFLNVDNNDFVNPKLIIKEGK